MKTKKGFTLVELLVVIVILGVLVLIASPKFLGYINKAQDVAIKADVKTFQNEIASKLITDEDFIKSLTDYDSSKLAEKINENKVYDKNGLVKSLPDDTTFKEISSDKVQAKSNEQGEFIVDEDGNVYFVADKAASNSSGDSSSEVQPPIVKETLEGNPDDWEFVSDASGYNSPWNAAKGFYQYVGNAKTVKIPTSINGDVITSYYRMFDSNQTVTKVISVDSSEVTSAVGMFQGSSVTTLDLRELDTSNMTRMSYMFAYNYSLESVELSNFNTSKVTSMEFMFTDTRKLLPPAFNSFDTTNLKTMNSMFKYSGVRSLDLSSFAPTDLKDLSEAFINTPNLVDVDISGINLNGTSLRAVNSMFSSSTTNNQLSKIYVNQQFYDLASTKYFQDNVANAKVIVKGTPEP